MASRRIDPSLKRIVGVISQSPIPSTAATPKSVSALGRRQDLHGNDALSGGDLFRNSDIAVAVSFIYDRSR